jgi:hypothetical protein
MRSSRRTSDGSIWRDWEISVDNILYGAKITMIVDAKKRLGTQQTVKDKTILYGFFMRRKAHGGALGDYE